MWGRSEDEVLCGLWEKFEQTRELGKGKNQAGVGRGSGAETGAGPWRTCTVWLMMVKRMR